MGSKTYPTSSPERRLGASQLSSSSNTEESESLETHHRPALFTHAQERKCPLTGARFTAKSRTAGMSGLQSSHLLLAPLIWCLRILVSSSLNALGFYHCPRRHGQSATSQLETSCVETPKGGFRSGGKGPAVAAGHFPRTPWACWALGNTSRSLGVLGPGEH